LALLFGEAVFHEEHLPSAQRSPHLRSETLHCECVCSGEQLPIKPRGTDRAYLLFDA
jgi:hypothetical protein